MLKYFRKINIFRKCYFPEKKIFSCVWLHFKKCFGKYFLMFGCVLEKIIENTFFTCCSHFLTFSQLPNEYIISFIPKNTNKTQKRSHFLGEITIAIDAYRGGSSDHDRNRCWSFSLSRAECVLFAWVFSFCGSLSLLRVLRKSFEGKTIM